MGANPSPTLHYSAISRIDKARSSYERAWHSALASGSGPPSREPYFTEMEDGERQALVTALDAVDDFYSRLGELLRSGAVRLTAPLAPSVNCSDFQLGGMPEYAETIDSKPDVESPPSPATTPPAEGAEVGGYELLGVIARGGMGVVYKARHVRLGRLAAIKMVISGSHASGTQLARFRAEAQVVAQLQHPNIVQLFEVGEHDGLPFIALEFVEGGSLAAKSGGQPQPYAEAAGRVELLARTMHFAHQHGVVHRDLKPANILLSPDGVPKVTDFGLAKRLEEDSGHTRTGTLMGTPSYMAPEQARGEHETVGPLSDVYALGAILYEQLTGRPPFAAGSAMETIRAVLEKDPVPPTRVQPSIPKDLETICLKCLEKEPGKRYADAASLADDLHRFLTGESILARPVGRIERLRKWCRRNPRVAALSSVILLLLTTVAVGSTVAALRVRAEKKIAEANATAARDALAEVDRQRIVANENAEAARSAQKVAEGALAQKESARADAEKARARADELAAVASAQGEIALEALGGIVTRVMDRLDDSEGSQMVKKEMLGLVQTGLRKLDPRPELVPIADMRMAEVHRRLGELARTVGDADLARRNFEQAGLIARKHLETDNTNRDWARTLSVVDIKLGDLALEGGNRAKAREYYQAAYATRTTLADEKPPSPAVVRDLAEVCVKIGDISSPDDAIGFYKEALQHREAILGIKPEDPAARRDVGLAHLKLADGHLRRKRPDEARSHALEAVDIASELAEKYPRQPLLRREQAMITAKLGQVLRAMKQPEAARERYAEAARLLAPFVSKNQRDLVLQVAYAQYLSHAGQFEEATTLAGRVAARVPKNAFLLYNVACVFAVAADNGGKKDDETTAKYRTAAMEHLTKAVAAGFADREQMQTDADLASIRDLPAFAELLKGLDKKPEKKQDKKPEKK